MILSQRDTNYCFPFRTKTSARLTTPPMNVCSMADILGRTVELSGLEEPCLCSRHPSCFHFGSPIPVSLPTGDPNCISRGPPALPSEPAHDLSCFLDSPPPLCTACDTICTLTQHAPRVLKKFWLRKYWAPAEGTKKQSHRPTGICCSMYFCHHKFHRQISCSSSVMTDLQK